jgi:hypothetical protein
MSAADPAVSAKLCTVCGIDCAGRPRIKDQQGRYICKECFDKAKQTRQTQKNPPPPAGSAPAETEAVGAAAEGDNSFLLNLGSTKESAGIAGTKPCPECGRAVPASAVICVGCGYNLSTGKRLQVKVIKAKQPKGEAKESKPLPGALGPWPVTGAFAAITIGLFAYGMTDPSIMGIYVLAVFAISAIVFISTIVMGFMDEPAAGFKLLLPIPCVIVLFFSGFLFYVLLLFGLFYHPYWIYARCGNLYMRGIWTVTALNWLILIIFAAQKISEAMEQFK